MREDTAAIDIQGFIGNNNKFILKEIGVVFKKDTKLDSHFIIHSPYDFTELNKKSRKTAAWLTKQHHKIYWNDGITFFKEAQMYLREIIRNREIICKGHEKRLFLNKFLKIKNILNVEEIGCPTLKTLDGNQFPYCSLHVQEGVCALNNAHKILNFYVSENFSN